MGGRCDRFPNSIWAHRLLHWALTCDPAKQHDLKGRIFAAYYGDNVFVGDVDVLARLAGEAGYDAAKAKAYLLSDAGTAEVNREVMQASRDGVRGVPHFKIGSQTLSGAQAPAAFVAAFEQA